MDNMKTTFQLRYLVCRDASGAMRIAAISRQKTLTYLNSEQKRISKLFPEYTDFEILTQAQWNAIPKRGAV